MARGRKYNAFLWPWFRFSATLLECGAGCGLGFLLS